MIHEQTRKITMRMYEFVLDVDHGTSRLFLPDKQGDAARTWNMVIPLKV